MRDPLAGIEPALFQCHLEDGDIQHFSGKFGTIHEVNGVKVVRSIDLFTAEQVRHMLATTQPGMNTEGD